MTPKLADFGILCIGPPGFSGDSKAYTKVGLGTPVFTPKEAGEEFDDQDRVIVRPSLDIYSLGVVCSMKWM